MFHDIAPFALAGIVLVVSGLARKRKPTKMVVTSRAPDGKVLDVEQDD